MPTEYDRRRPRIPDDLAAAIDSQRGQTPFNRFVVGVLGRAVGWSAPGPAPEAKPASPPAPKPAKSKGSRRAAPTGPKPLKVDEALEQVRARHRQARGMGSAQAKASVRPIPRKGS